MTLKNVGTFTTTSSVTLTLLPTDPSFLLYELAASSGKVLFQVTLTREVDYAADHDLVLDGRGTPQLLAPISLRPIANDTPLPGADEPSDHLPVLSRFRWRS